MIPSPSQTWAPLTYLLDMKSTHHVKDLNFMSCLLAPVHRVYCSKYRLNAHVSLFYHFGSIHHRCYLSFKFFFIDTTDRHKPPCKGVFET